MEEKSKDLLEHIITPEIERKVHTNQKLMVGELKSVALIATKVIESTG